MIQNNKCDKAQGINCASVEEKACLKSSLGYISDVDCQIKDSKDRIEFFIKYLGLKSSTFCKILELSEDVFSEHITNEIAQKISSKFKELNVDWLLTGLGNPIKTEFESNRENFDEDNFFQCEHRLNTLDIYENYVKLDFISDIELYQLRERTPEEKRDKISTLSSYFKPTDIALKVSRDSLRNYLFCKSDKIVLRQLSEPEIRENFKYSKDKVFMFYLKNKKTMLAHIFSYDPENSQLEVLDALNYDDFLFDEDYNDYKIINIFDYDIKEMWIMIGRIPFIDNSK